MIKAGIKRKEITPPEGLELAGYPHYPRNNEGAHDPLYATCMYISDGIEEIAMISLDLLYFSKQYVKAAREKAEQLCGIKKKNIMISSTHTHSGPWAHGGRVSKEYIESVISTIAELICDAKKDVFDAEFTSGVTMCGAESGVGGNRRVKGGPHDPLVGVLAVRDLENKIRGVFVNYALHPTFIHEWSNVCTADFPCYLKKQVEETEKDAIAAFTQGTEGNQSSRYYRQGESYGEAERVGRTLGKAALEVLKNAVWVNEVNIKVERDEIPVDIRCFGTEEELREKVAHDREIYEELYKKFGKSENRDEYCLWQNANLKLLGSENQLNYVVAQNNGVRIPMLEDEVPAEVQVFMLNDTCVVGLQGEIFVEYGLFIKAMAGVRTTIINGVTNGALPGYMYTPEALVTGGYETDTSMIDEKFGMKYVNFAIETINKVK